MPQVQFSYPAKNILKTITMPSPKLISDLWRGWYRQIRKRIPEVPAIGEPDRDGRLWRHIGDPDVSTDWIKYTLENDIGQKAHLVVARRLDTFGR